METIKAKWMVRKWNNSKEFQFAKWYVWEVSPSLARIADGEWEVRWDTDLHDHVSTLDSVWDSKAEAEARLAELEANV